DVFVGHPAAIGNVDEIFAASAEGFGNQFLRDLNLVGFEDCRVPEHPPERRLIACHQIADVDTHGASANDSVLRDFDQSEGCELRAAGLVQRYPDRVLFLVTPLCPVYCRYCTRSRMVGDTAGHSLGVEEWTSALEYIGAHPEIRDVLLSGGDPLLLSDDRL